MDASTITGAQQILQYEFHQPNLLLEALQAPGPESFIGGEHLPQGNKRLALCGISVLTMSVNLTSYQTRLSTEKATAEVQARTSPTKLAQLTRNSTLDMYIKMNPAQKDGRPAPVLMADTLKAVLAAVWIDCGSDIKVWTGVAKSLGVFG